MKRVYKLRDLECANCAAKMEAAVAKLDGGRDCEFYDPEAYAGGPGQCF